MRLHLHPPRHTLVTSLFWLVAFLPWMTLFSSAALLLRFPSELLTVFSPIAFWVSLASCRRTGGDCDARVGCCPAVPPRSQLRIRPSQTASHSGRTRLHDAKGIADLP